MDHCQDKRAWKQTFFAKQNTATANKKYWRGHDSKGLSCIIGPHATEDKLLIA